jgi:hypothetical protein
MLQIFEILENSFFVEVSDAPEKFQIEFIDLQHDLILRSSFNKETSLNCYSSLVVSLSSDNALFITSRNARRCSGFYKE